MSAVFASLEPYLDMSSDASSLTEIDIKLMQRLSHRVNVIPVIGRADSFTIRELKAFKKRVSSVNHFSL